MKLSRIDIIGLNGGDGLHYHELDILDRLESATKVNGAYPKDIADAITEIKRLREDAERWRWLTTDGAQLLKKVFLSIVLLLLVATVLLAGITFIGLLPLLIFEDPITRAINMLIDAITR